MYNVLMKPELGPNQQSRQEILLGDLLSKKIRLYDLIEELFTLDQFSSDRKEALNNVKIIEDQGVWGFVRGATDEDVCHFFNFASLTHLHVFQILIKDGEQRAVALEHLEKANEYAQKINKEEYDDWKNYVSALLAYSRNDIESLRKLCDKIPDKQFEVVNNLSFESENINKQIVLDLIKKLEQNGKPVYN